MRGGAKRSVEEVSDASAKRHTADVGNPKDENGEDLVFEDPFGDDIDDEEMVEEQDDDDDEDVDEEITTGKDVDMEDDDEEKMEKKVFLPGVNEVGDGEELDYDSSAYDMYYAMTAEWPALSIDVVRDNLGAVRTKFPLSMYMVAGTQASSRDENQITVMKMADLYKTKQKDPNSDSDSEDESDDENSAMDGDPLLESRAIPHPGGVNRIRCMPQSSNIVATWADTKEVHLWDIANQLQSLDGSSKPVPSMKKQQTPIYTYSGHADEGFGMDWSPVVPGQLATGDCASKIYVWQPQEGGTWNVDPTPFSGHRASVEDLQWSPTEASVLASCSADRSIKIWDTRRKENAMLSCDNAHTDDVNVISWNSNVAYLLASGSDDGTFKIWDMRNFKPDAPVANFRYHTAPITSIEWHPNDESVVAVSGADNQLSVWDMSVEEDKENASAAEGMDVDVPPQLLFIHQGQSDIKELHFHPQCPGVLVSTASDGFNVFKPNNIS